MAFPDSFLRELSERNEITDVVSEYVKLTKRSGSNLFGLCPFHSEKTPSFSVSPDKQIYHCFGCGKGGSVINFIMEIENLSFADAVRFLARRAGMQVPEDGEDPKIRDHRERMLRLNKDAARFFYEQLISPSGAPAQYYVNQRGISATMVKNFGLGYAPDSWDTLVRAMTAKGYSFKDLTDAGLAKHSSKGRGIYDAFRNRLMFPVIDVRGSVIGFSGRILGDGEPKYLNSPETTLFSKSRNLFALNLAKKSKSGYIILTEGNIDVVSLHQAGFDSAVASLGTSLTAEQARLLSRYTDQIILAYDNDEAGKKASQRAISILEKLDLKVRVLRLQGTKDPDEYIKLKGPDAFRNLLERSENHTDYQLQIMADKYDIATDDGRLSFLKDATSFLAGISNAVEREVYCGRISDKCGVSKTAVISEVERTRRRRIASQRKKDEKEASRPARSSPGANKGPGYENIRSAAAEEGIIRLLVMDPELFIRGVPLLPEEFSSPLLGRFYEQLLERAKLGESLSPASLSAMFSGEEISLLTTILEKPEDPSHAGKALSDYIEIISTQHAKSQSKTDLRAAAEEYKKKKGYGV